ncbi:MAG: hypothetical protein ACM3S4_13020 [Burkholderiales bacterium]
MRKISFKIVALMLCLAAAVAVFSGCGTVTLAKPTPLPGVPTYKITGSCEIAINGDVVTVSGKTDLDSGALINISVVAQNGMTIDSVTVTQNKANDTISADFNIAGKTSGVEKIVGYISCAPTLYGSQTDGVYQKYGKKFEYIEADNKNLIWGNDGNVVAFASDMIDLPKL